MTTRIASVESLTADLETVGAAKWAALKDCDRGCAGAHFSLWKRQHVSHNISFARNRGKKKFFFERLVK
eukprot:1702432-Amphidinium_carterae.1